MQIQEEVGAAQKPPAKAERKAAEPSQLDKDLMDAAMAGKASRVAELLAKGAHINAVDDRGWTPLMMATWDGHERCVSVLVEAGADQSIRQEHGLTAAKLAESIGAPKVLELLQAKELAMIAAERMKAQKSIVREAVRMPDQPQKPWNERQAEAKRAAAGARPVRREGQGFSDTTRKFSGGSGGKPHSPSHGMKR